MNRAPRSPEEINAGPDACPYCRTTVCLEREKVAWQAIENWRELPTPSRKDSMGWAHVNWTRHCSSHRLAIGRAFLLRKSAYFDH